MGNSKILLVTNAFLPEISPRSFRATELCKEFARQGHEVTVLTKKRDYDYSKFLKDYPIKLEMWSESRLPKIPKFRRKPLSYLSRAFYRFFSVFFEYPNIEEMFRVKKNLKKKNGYHLLISFAVPYPIHWGVAWARTKINPIGDTWIADCGDPFMGNILDTFKKPFYFKYVEKWFSRETDYITIPIESAKNGYYREFHYKIRVIPQGFDFKIDGIQKSDPKNSIPTFAYAGGFLEGARDPRPLLNYLSTIDRQFKFIVYTNTREIIDEYQPVLKEKLSISGYIPREKLLERLKEMDFLINFDNNTHLNSPSKLIDYAITGRPVLNIKKDFQYIEIEEFLNADYSKQLVIPDIRKYHISNVATQFLELADLD